jgi:hypothetical protein
MGTLVASFRFTARGISITESVESVANRCRVTLSVVDPNGPELRLVVALDGGSEAVALQHAQRIAEAVYERMLLDLSPHVAGTTRPIRENHTFTDPAGVSTTAGISVGMSVAIAEGVATLDSSRVKPALDGALSAVEVGQLATSADVYTARALYRVAMETNDAVASYLICYSALQLAAMFKRSGATQQSDVDALLTREDPRIQLSLDPLDARSKPKPESPFTTARNRFVHAEGRGKNSEAAAGAMRDLLPTLRDLTARILRKL